MNHRLSKRLDIDSFCFGGEKELSTKNEEKRKMTRQEAGRIGGEKVARERGSEFYRQIGKKGGEKVAEQRGSEFYRAIGQKGGESRENKAAKGGKPKSYTTVKL